jgi:hypothetical protein
VVLVMLIAAVTFMGTTLVKLSLYLSATGRLPKDLRCVLVFSQTSVDHRMAVLDVG